MNVMLKSAKSQSLELAISVRFSLPSTMISDPKSGVKKHLTKPVLKGSPYCIIHVRFEDDDHQAWILLMFSTDKVESFWLINNKKIKQTFAKPYSYILKLQNC